MKSLKAGVEPKRGNPNKPEDQEQFDTNEGSKPSIRSSGGGGASGYPSLAPQPDLGLPGDDEEEDKNESSSDQDDDSSDEPEKKPTPAPKKPTPARSRGATVKKDKNFYKGIEQAKKHCKNSISNLGYNKVDSTIEELEQALEILRGLQ